MSSSQDLVGIATGKIHIPVRALSLAKRIRLFRALASVLQRHYLDQVEGSTFTPWQEESFGEKLTTHSLGRYSLAIDESFYPKEKDYNKSTRITTLAGDYFRFQDFKKPENGNWNLGDTKLVVRICLTHNGTMYLEWYTGTVSEMHKEYTSLPVRVIVYSAKYIVIPSFFSIYEVPEELKILLTKDPEMLYSFGHGCLSLLKKEEETKRNLADRDAKAFADFSDIGRIFQIRYP